MELEDHLAQRCLCPHNQTGFAPPGQLETQLALTPPGYKHYCFNPVPWAPPGHVDQGGFPPKVVLEILLEFEDILILEICHPED